MSFLKKIEDDYYNGKISFEDYTKLTEEYSKQSVEEKLKLDNQHKNFGHFTTPDENEPVVNYLLLWLFSCGLFGLLFFYQKGVRGQFSDGVILDFFFSFLFMGFIPMALISLISLPIKLFLKINSWKLLFWTSIFFGVVNVLNGTFAS